MLMLTLTSSTQVAWAVAVALAMITAGVGKKRLEWKRRPPRWWFGGRK
jgi:hypothetical protein